MSVWQSSLLSSLFFCSFSVFAWAAESAHQINTEMGIGFRLETEQVTHGQWEHMEVRELRV